MVSDLECTRVSICDSQVTLAVSYFQKQHFWQSSNGLARSWADAQCAYSRSRWTVSQPQEDTPNPLSICYIKVTNTNNALCSDYLSVRDRVKVRATTFQSQAFVTNPKFSLKRWRRNIILWLIQFNTLSLFYTPNNFQIVQVALQNL